MLCDYSSNSPKWHSSTSQKNRSGYIEGIILNDIFIYNLKAFWNSH